MSLLTRSLPTGRASIYHLHKIQNLRRRNLSLILNPPFVFPHSDFVAGSVDSQQSHAEQKTQNFSFLEELSPEYGSTQKPPDSSPIDALELHAAQDAKENSRLLAKLIYHYKFERAQVLRDEFLRSGAGISPHYAFVKACHHGLNIMDAEQRAHSFLGWLSFVPIKRRPFILRPMIAHLMRHPFDLVLLMDACVVITRQGFLKALVDQKTPTLLLHIFRFGNPNATTAFLLKLEREAQEHSYAGQTGAWKYIRGIAIEAHLSTGRGQIAQTLYDSAIDNASIEAETRNRLTRFPSTEILYKNVKIPCASLRRSGLDRMPNGKIPPSELAKELRILRRAVVSGPNSPPFESFLANFMHGVDGIEGRRSKAVELLRHKAWTRGSLAVRARWVASEMLYYSSLRRPLAVLRTFYHYCHSDHILCHEIERVLIIWHQRKYSVDKRPLDLQVAPQNFRIRFKILPSRMSVKLAWKAIIQLSQTEDLSRLYNQFLSYLDVSQSTPKALSNEIQCLLSSPDSEAIDQLYFHRSRSFVTTPGSSVPDATSFHAFVVAFATRLEPRKGMRVIDDMLNLGFTPHLDAWSTAAGAYARSGDEHRTVKLLDYIDALAGIHDLESMTPQTVMTVGDGRDINVDEQTDVMADEAHFDDDTDSLETERRGEVIRHHQPSGRIQRSLRACYNSLIRGFTECGHFEAARRIQQRGWILGVYDNALDKRTLAIFHRLARYEKGKWDGLLRKRNVVVRNGTQLYIDQKRVEWIKEESG